MAYQLVCSVPFVDTGSGWACTGVTTSSEVNPSFDVSTLDPAVLGGAVGSGFIVAGVPLVVILVSRLIIDSIRGK